MECLNDRPTDVTAVIGRIYACKICRDKSVFFLSLSLFWQLIVKHKVQNIIKIGRKSTIATELQTDRIKTKGGDNMQPEFVSVKQLAELAGVSTQAVYSRINSDLQGFVRLDGSKKTVDTAALRYFGQQEVQVVSNQDPEITREMFDLLNLQLQVVNQKVFIRDEQINRLLEQLKWQSEMNVQLQEEKRLLLEEPPPTPEPNKSLIEKLMFWK